MEAHLISGRGSVRPAHLHGFLTYVDPATNLSFIQDSTGGARLQTLAPLTTSDPGKEVDVTGMAPSGGTAPLVTLGLVKFGRRVNLPDAPAVTGADLLSARWESRRVTVTGVIASITLTNSSTQTIDLWSGDRRIRVRVPNASLEGEILIDAEMRASGTLVISRDYKGNPSIVNVYAPNKEALVILKPAPPVRNIQALKVQDLIRLGGTERFSHRIRLRGAVERAPDGRSVFRDNSGEATLLDTELDPATNVNLLGFAERVDGALVIENGVLTSADAKIRANDSESARNLQVISSAREARAFPLREISPRVSVNLHGVVTYSERPGTLFIDDGTDGIFVYHQFGATQFMPGDLVRVTGPLASGQFAPIVMKAKVEKIGFRPLPPLKFSDPELAFMGRMDSRRVRLSGVVQHATDSELFLSWGKNRFQLHMPSMPPDLRSLVGSRITVDGVCAGLFNARRQLLGVQVFAQDRTHIHVERPAPADIYSLPLSLSDQLLQFSVADNVTDPVRLRGKVTLTDHESAIWIRDARGGIMIHTAEPSDAEPGDLVDAIGFAAAGPFTPVLEDARLRKDASGPRPRPVDVSAYDGTPERCDAELVRLDAKLIDRVQGPTEQTLLLQAGSTTFRAYARNDLGLFVPPVQSMVRLQGVCSVEVDNTKGSIVTEGFRLNLGSKDDLKTLRAASWWTPQRLVEVLAGSCFLIVSAILWIFFLKRKVRHQTDHLVRKSTQLERAHDEVQNALRRAQKAEKFETHQKSILGLIVKNEALDVVMRDLAAAVESCWSGIGCMVEIRTEQHGQIIAAPSLSVPLQEKLAAADFHWEALPNTPCSLVDLSHHPAWQVCFDADAPSRLMARPILQEAHRIGSVFLILPLDTETTEGNLQMLDAWTNLVLMAVDRRRLFDRLSYHARHDGLTGLPNRTQLCEQLNHEIVSATSASAEVALLYLDLNGFKEINDNLGHGAGDIVLKHVASRISATVRRGDTVARMGGDEFVVLLPNIHSRSDASRIASDIAAAIQHELVIEGERVGVAASIGIALYPSDAPSVDALLRVADSAMYVEKQAAHERRGPVSRDLHLLLSADIANGVLH